MKKTDQIGQTLVVIVLVMAVSLAVGLAVSTRSLKTLKETSYTAQSLAAYHAAEAGVEVALKRIANGECPLPTPDCSSSGTLAGASYSYTVSAGGVEGNYSLTLEKDKTREIKLAEYTGSSLRVCWDRDADPDPEAALEMFLVYGEPESYSLKKYAVDGLPDRRSDNSFSLPSSGEDNYTYCYDITGLSSPQILRMRPLYNGTSAVVKPATAYNLPPQSYAIESTGRAGETVRKVRVTKSLPALPEIFDFAIFTPEELAK